MPPGNKKNETRGCQTYDPVWPDCAWASSGMSEIWWASNTSLHISLGIFVSKQLAFHLLQFSHFPICKINFQPKISILIFISLKSKQFAKFIFKPNLSTYLFHFTQFLQKKSSVEKKQNVARLLLFDWSFFQLDGRDKIGKYKRWKLIIELNIHLWTSQ